MNPNSPRAQEFVKASQKLAAHIMDQIPDNTEVHLAFSALHGCCGRALAHLLMEVPEETRSTHLYQISETFCQYVESVIRNLEGRSD